MTRDSWTSPPQCISLLKNMVNFVRIYFNKYGLVFFLEFSKNTFLHFKYELFLKRECIKHNDSYDKDLFSIVL